MKNKREMCAKKLTDNIYEHTIGFKDIKKVLGSCTVECKLKFIEHVKQMETSSDD